MSDNAEAAARRAAHGILAGVLFAIPECEKVHPCNRDGSASWLTEPCDRLTAYILTTETRLAAAEEALEQARAVIKQADEYLRRAIHGERTSQFHAVVGTFLFGDPWRAALTESPGEGAGALTPGTGRGGEAEEAPGGARASEWRPELRRAVAHALAVAIGYCETGSRCFRHSPHCDAIDSVLLDADLGRLPRCPRCGNDLEWTTCPRCSGAAPKPEEQATPPADLPPGETR